MHVLCGRRRVLNVRGVDVEVLINSEI